MGSGYMTDEELELCQTIDQPSADINNTAAANDSSDITHVHNRATNNATPQQTTTTSMDATALPYNATAAAADSLTSPSTKEVLIGGDNNPSRR